MVFSIVAFKKGIDTYRVVNEAGEVMDVHGIQIVGAMVQGHTFNNAHLTKKGFGIQTDSGVRYIQVPMDKNCSRLVAEFIARKAEEEKRQAEAAKAQVKAKARAKVARSAYNYACLSDMTVMGTLRFEGNSFKSVEELCAKYNRDVNLFLELKKKGYSAKEALGLVPLRTEAELAEAKRKHAAAMDKLAQQRGEW